MMNTFPSLLGMTSTERRTPAECTDLWDTFHNKMTVNNIKIMMSLTSAEPPAEGIYVFLLKLHESHLDICRRGRREEREKMLWSKSDDNLDSCYNTFNDRSSSQYWR